MIIPTKTGWDQLVDPFTFGPIFNFTLRGNRTQLKIPIELANDMAGENGAQFNESAKTELMFMLMSQDSSLHHDDIGVAYELLLQRAEELRDSPF